MKEIMIQMKMTKRTKMCLRRRKMMELDPVPLRDLNWMIPALGALAHLQWQTRSWTTANCFNHSLFYKYHPHRENSYCKNYIMCYK